MQDIIDIPQEPSLPDDKYLQAYFGRQSGYYIEKFEAYTSGDKFSFNIAPFFIGFFWFFYRKLWLEGILIILFILVSGMIEGVIYDLFAVSEDTQTMIFYVSSFAFGVLWGFVGNYLYIRKADKNIKNVLMATDDEEERMYLLTKKGGVSLVPFIILLLLIIVFLLI
ncbi:hypothetical protein C900_02023 [Fulvivirga imtechensis AK7]|uniref:DUF2628 domain-containing protein n=1 Tax=Fulvivirga imtechensis AK7 TaxID=1237149 RepID=L8JUX0_9BACT|nr:DUF2628 domain-containing protein [Fulvivirga imtechensis]ELR72028.1 hypothetical protein C900_02023 [Fulvivirga imtechensis AK7]